jgi:DNA helicase-2/ATP-dependent DNA helicase PcrA
VIRLEQNYRSTQTILDAANALVMKNLTRLGKNLWSEKGRGDSIQVMQAADERGEALNAVNIILEETSRHSFSFNDIVMLYRTNAQSRALEEQLRHANIPYTIVGGVKFYERKEIKDILAYLKVLVNPSDTISLERIINFPTRGIGSTTLRLLREKARSRNSALYQILTRIQEFDDFRSGVATKIADFLDDLEKMRENLDQMNAYQITENTVSQFRLKQVYENTGLVEDETRLENINEFLNSIEIFVSDHTENASLEKFIEEISLITDIDNWDPDRPVVTMMTLHSAKGLEFPVVIITGLEDGLMPISRNSDGPEELEEERRLLYVGMTRAMDRLYLLHAKTRHRFGREEFGTRFRNIPSRFLLEIPKQYVSGESLHSYGKTDHSRDTFAEKTGDGLYLERLPDEGSDFKIGQHVQHDVFGRGQILGVESTRMGTKLVVQFENVSIKKLIAEYANLTISDSLE